MRRPLEISHSSSFFLCINDYFGYESLQCLRVHSIDFITIKCQIVFFFSERTLPSFTQFNIFLELKKRLKVLALDKLCALNYSSIDDSSIQSIINYFSKEID